MLSRLRRKRSRKSKSVARRNMRQVLFICREPAVYTQILSMCLTQQSSNLVFIAYRSIRCLPSLCIIDIQTLVFPVFEEQSHLLPCPTDIWNDQKGDRMVRLKERMVRVVLMLLSALTPGKVALRPIPVEKRRFSARSHR